MPPAKKRRAQAARAAAGNNLVKEDSPIDEIPVQHMDIAEMNSFDASAKAITQLRDKHREVMSILLENIDLVPQVADKSELLLASTLALAELKSLQREISLQVERHAETAKQQRAKVEACSLTLENLKYERNYLQGIIGEIKEWKAEELERMARDELEIDPTNADINEVELSSSNGVRKDSSTDKISSSQVAIDTYLFGHPNDSTSSTSHRDPSQYSFIVNKLQSDIVTRSSLVDELTKYKVQLKELQKKRDDIREMLQRIPQNIAHVEKAAESLSVCFESNDVWKNNITTVAEDTEDGRSMTKDKVLAANLLISSPSSQRTLRFQLAQSNLPSPLYVLFVQLAGYIDALSCIDHLEKEEKQNNALGDYVRPNTLTVKAVPPMNKKNERNEDTILNIGHWNVELSLSVYDILPDETMATLSKTQSNSRAKIPTKEIIKIIFSYDVLQGMVRAEAMDEKNNALKDDLLGNLFPGDNGSVNLNIPLLLLKDNETDEQDYTMSDVEETNNGLTHDDNTTGKPYYWCQVLSGLNFPPPSTGVKTMTEDAPFQIHFCTKSVMRQLFRRVRASQTLSIILDFLAKRSQSQPLPIHPAFVRDESPHSPSFKAKLVSWVEENITGNQGSNPLSMRRFVASIKRKSACLKAIVDIDVQNYPAEPPVWSFQSDIGTTVTNAWGEYQSTTTLLHDVNNRSGPPLYDAAMQRIQSHINSNLDQFVVQGVEATYDWILIHQLVDIVSCWDELMSAGEGSGNGKRKDREDPRRLRKGKDRRLVGFGDQSPFFYYRCGH